MNTGLRLPQKIQHKNSVSGDKEYFLIMNIAMGGEYTGIEKQDYWGDNGLIPSNFEYADMVIKNVTYEISSLNTFELKLNL